jgi:TonB family protein
MRKRRLPVLYNFIPGVCLLLCYLPMRAMLISPVPPGTASDTAARYKDKVVMLRNSYCGRELIFDTSGRFLSGGQAGAWTLCRDMRIRKVRVADGKLKITGQRIYLFYDSRLKQFRDITENEPSANKETKSYKEMIEGQNVSIEMQLLPAPDDGSIADAMDKLFYRSEAEFIQTVPHFWKKALAEPESRPNPGKETLGVDIPRKQEPPSGTNPGEIFHVGNGVSPPLAVYSPDPDYSDEARGAKYQGTVVLTTIVGPDGRIRDPRIARPVGMGLDEKALEKILAWRFKPATKDDKPVAVEVTIEIQYNLY